MTVHSNSQQRYTVVAVVLHYVLALGLVALFVFGLYMADLPFSPTRLKLFNWHKWAGISILVLSALRLIWRLTHPAPSLPAGILQKMPDWQVKVHDWTQIAFYLLFFITPLIGWAYTSAAGFPVVLFGQFPLPDFVGPDKALAALIKPFHKFSAFALAALVVLHIAAVVKHQFIDRDGLLKRMSLRR